MPEALNFSNNVINTRAIEGLIALFEGDGVFEFWAANVANPNLDAVTFALLKRNFPRANYLRQVILKLAWSIPTPMVEASHDLPKAERKALNKRLKELKSRREWEGTKTFDAAVLWWRAWAFVTGDVFVKLPLAVDDEGELAVFPERLPAQRTYVKMNPDVRKVIDGYRFQYYLGSGMYTEQGDMSLLTTEWITRDEWRIERANVKVDKSGQITEKRVIGEELVDTLGMLRVAHLAWEAREDGPRGVPLALRLADKALHVMTTALDRRLGNKMGSVPVYKLLNSQGEIPALSPGAVISLKTESPHAPADFSAVTTGFSDDSLQREYKDAKRELYDEAFLPFDEDKETGATQPSGKALQMLSKDQVKYREAFQIEETSFLQGLFSKCLTLEGEEVDEDDICIKYDDDVTPNATERLAEAQFFQDAGYEEKALMIMGVEEEEAKAMVTGKAERQAEELLANAENIDPETGLFKKKQPTEV